MCRPGWKAAVFPVLLVFFSGCLCCGGGSSGGESTTSTSTLHTLPPRPTTTTVDSGFLRTTSTTSTTTLAPTTTSTTTTTLEPTTTVYTTTTTTTTLYKHARCRMNKDCGEPYEQLVCAHQPDAVVSQRVAYRCDNAGTKEAKCVTLLTTVSRKDCTGGTYCREGECIPRPE